MEKTKKSAPRSNGGFPEWFDAEELARLEEACAEFARSMGASKAQLPCAQEIEEIKRSAPESDAAGKEMILLSQEGMCLRPEGTAQCLGAWRRAGGTRLGEQRKYYIGPMFRNETPQAGRLRQFTQFGLEWINVGAGPADALLCAETSAFLDRIGLRGKWRLRVNTLGSSSERALCARALRDWLAPKKEELSSSSQRRLETNPLRIWDSKDEKDKALLASAPKLLSFLGEESLRQWETFKEGMRALKSPFEEDASLVRGLDYYTGIVFEWVSMEDKAQNALGAGGRYDGLSAALGGEEAPALGLALGIERLQLARAQEQSPSSELRFCVWDETPGAQILALRCAQGILRSGVPAVVAQRAWGWKKAFEKANRMRAREVWMIGAREIERGSASVKDMVSGVQREEPWPWEKGQEGRP